MLEVKVAPAWRKIAVAATGVGLLAVAVVVAWWWLIFGEVIATTGLSVPDALTCMIGHSDLCSLAQSLCKSSHFLGLRRYSVEAFWFAGLILTAGSIAIITTGQGRRAT